MSYQKIETSACAVGLVAGESPLDVRKIDWVLQTLAKLPHRGGQVVVKHAGQEIKVGDGAGVRCSIDWSYYDAKIAEFGIKKPQDRKCAIGNFFLPVDEEARRVSCEEIAKICERNGFDILSGSQGSWRDIPFESSDSQEARELKLQKFQQCFLAPKEVDLDEKEFARRLLLIHREIEEFSLKLDKSRQVEGKGVAKLAVASISGNEIIYKGMLLPHEVAFFEDLRQSDPQNIFYHIRQSTNVSPSPGNAQPFSLIAHNGELNSIAGNVYKQYKPARGFSDSRSFDDQLRDLLLEGYDIVYAMTMLMPPPLTGNEAFDAMIKDMKARGFEYNGPAHMVFSQGKICGAVLDANALRPSRYLIARNATGVISLFVGSEDMLSESEMQKMGLEPVERGMLKAGEMIIIDGGVIKKHQQILQELQARYKSTGVEVLPVIAQELTDIPVKLPYGTEELESRKYQLLPLLERHAHKMAMGNDTPPIRGKGDWTNKLAEQFAQKFSQVSSPPIDSRAERDGFDLTSYLGNSEEKRLLKLASPLLKLGELEAIKTSTPDKVFSIDLTFDLLGDYQDKDAALLAMKARISEICFNVEEQVRAGKSIIILDCSSSSPDKMALPDILVTAAVYSHLHRCNLEKKASLVVNSVQMDSAHHFSILSAVGAACVNPALAYNFAVDLARGDKAKYSELCDNFHTAVNEAHMITMGKYGITSASVYHASRLVETITLDLTEGQLEEYDPSNLSHAFNNIEIPDNFRGKLKAQDLLDNALFQHEKAYGNGIFTSGRFAYKADGIPHTYNPSVVAAVRDATNEYRTKRSLKQKFSDIAEILQLEERKEIQDFDAYKLALTTKILERQELSKSLKLEIAALENQQEKIVNSLFFVDGVAKELERIAQAQKSDLASGVDIEDMVASAFESRRRQFSLNEVSIRGFLLVSASGDGLSVTKAFKEYKSGKKTLQELKGIIFSKAGYDSSQMADIENWARLTREEKPQEAAEVFLRLNPKNQDRIKEMQHLYRQNQEKIAELKAAKMQVEREQEDSKLLFSIAQHCQDSGSYKESLRQEIAKYQAKAQENDLLPTIEDGRFNVGQVDARLVDSTFKKANAEIAANKSRSPVTIADHLDLKLEACTPLVDKSQLQKASEIAAEVFVTGGMSHGALTLPAHLDVAKSAQLLGAKACTGEGGKPEGEVAKSVQVASGRFGLNPEYFADADVIEIKVVQGAKPGQGGLLGAGKVTVQIAAQRQSPVGIGLTSPPPHHDIYSIEDLQELIHDLKELKPNVKVAVKVCASSGIGEIAKGLAKSGCDIINIAGGSGGTGAAEVDAIKSTGMPAEIGLAIANQALLEAGIRDLVKLQVSGFPFTPEGVIKMAILGGDIFESGTFDLMLLGCDMHRKCNIPGACGPGITNNEKGYQGHAEDLALYKLNMARAVQDLLVQIGVGSLKELRGRTDLLSAELLQDKVSQDFIAALMNGNQHLEKKVSQHLLDEYRRAANEGTNENQHKELVTKGLPEAILKAEKAVFQVDEELEVTNRTFGARLAFANREALESNPLEDKITIKTCGNAGQSYGAFNVHGLCLEHVGAVQDGFGKSMSGGVLVVKQPESELAIEQSSIYVGNAALYGAMGGKAFLPSAGSRFAILMKGAIAVVNGNVGDRACSYMTSGSVLILGEVGKSFASAMIGGIAVVYDNQQLQENADIRFAQGAEAEAYYDAIKKLLEEDVARTDSVKAKAILENFEVEKLKFKIVIPRSLDQIKTLEQLKENEEAFALRYAAKKFGVEATISPFEKCWFKVKRQQLEAQQAKAQVVALDVRLEGALQISEEFAEISQNHADKMRRYGALATRIVGGLGVEDQVLSDDVGQLMAELFEHGKKCSCDAVTCTKSEEVVEDKHTSSGCPLSKNPNLINGILKDKSLTEEERAFKAFQAQIQQSPFAGFTGLACPAPCESSCTHSAANQGNAEAVKIKRIELLLHRLAVKNGWYDELKVFDRVVKNGERVMIVGSGPSALEAAYHLAKAGFQVEIFEKSDKIGGLLRYGIPDHKLQKETIDFYVEKLAQMGVQFYTNSEVDIKRIKEYQGYDLYLDGSGVVQNPIIFDERFSATQPEKGHSMAMDFLTYCNEFYQSIQDEKPITHPFERFNLGKRLVVLGAGDTAEDVKRSVLKLNQYLEKPNQVELITIDRQPERGDLAAEGSSYPHDRETASRDLVAEMRAEENFAQVQDLYQTSPKGFQVNDDGKITGVLIDETLIVNPEFVRSHREKAKIMSASTVKCDSVITAIGFRAPQLHEGMVRNMSEITSGSIVPIGDVATKTYFANGSELIVNAQAIGKEVVNRYLAGRYPATSTFVAGHDKLVQNSQGKAQASSS